jgi:hypothetical protein
MIVNGIGRETVARARPARVRGGFGGELARADADGAAAAASDEAAAARVAAGGAVAGAAALAAPLAVEEREARARREADRLLGGLRQAQLALLGHGSPEAARAALAAGEAAAPADPGLQALLRALRVRAAIEGFRQQGGL